MRARIDKFLEHLRSSYWFIPAIMAFTAFILALVAISLDRWLGDGWLRSLPFVDSSRPDGARAVVSAIGGSMIGVAGTVFSVTMAAVVYASGQYGPRLLTNFLSDRGNQITLGTFTATFVFSMMILRTIQSPSASSGTVGAAATGFVPNLGLVVCIVLALCSIAVLIYFIHHVPSRIHISHVIRGIGEALIGRIDLRFPKSVGEGPSDAEELAARRRQLPAAFRDGTPDAFGEVIARTRGYIQFLDEKTLIEAARRNAVIVRLIVRPGAFISEGTVIFEVFPAERLTEEVADELRAAIATGALRTPADDMLFLIDELVEIAARALSPGVNDPFTAVGCMDWLGGALGELACRPTPAPFRTDGDGTLCIVAVPFTFADYLHESLGAIREYAAADKIAAVHFLRTIERIAGRCMSQERLESLADEAANLVELSLKTASGPTLREIEAEAATVFQAIRSPLRRRPFPDLGASLGGA